MRIIAKKQVLINMQNIKLKNKRSLYYLFILIKQPTLQLAGDDKEENNFQYARKCMSVNTLYFETTMNITKSHYIHFISCRDENFVEIRQ